MENPLVSVVVPCYRQAEFVGDAIRSVLDQTYPRFELVVVDDASPDDTARVVAGFSDPRIKVVTHAENRGLSASRNSGIAASTGDIVALLDADDMFHRDKLKLHVAFLGARPEIGVSYNARFEMNHSAATVRELWRPPVSVGLRELMLAFPFGPSDMVIRREWFTTAGVFDPAVGSAEDTDLPCRFALAGCGFAGVDRALNFRRYHSGRPRRNLRGRLEDVTRVLDAVTADPRCPAEVAALRGVAAKTHLMAVMSLALIQGEVELGRQFVRDLLRLDPSVLQGEPCELLDYLVQECIADDSLDHADLLARVLDQLPPEADALTARHRWAVSRGCLWRGIRAVMWGRSEDGRRHFQRALAFDAVIDDSLLGAVTQHLLDQRVECGAEVVGRVLDELVPELDRFGRARPGTRLQALYLVNSAFESYRGGRYRDVPAAVLQAAVRDPSHLRNRGVLSILARSIGHVAGVRP